MNLDLVAVYPGKIIIRLKAHPYFGGAPESLFESHGHFGRNGAFSGEDIRETMMLMYYGG